jgi:hypothetical protein
MGLGLGIVLTAIGAILAWAVNVNTSGFNVHAVGYILLVVGILSIVLSMVFWSSWAGPRYFTRSSGTRRRVIEEDIV